MTKAILAVLAAGAAIVAPAAAAPLTWTFDNIYLNNDATVVGSFTYDADTNSFTNINIVASGGTSGRVHTALFTKIGSLGIYSDATQALFMPDAYDGGSLDEWEFLYIFHPSDPRTNLGGIVGFGGGGSVSWGNCGDAACDTADPIYPSPAIYEPIGTLQAANVGAIPEPASWAMLIAGFGLMGAIQRRQRRIAA